MERIHKLGGLQELSRAEQLVHFNCCKGASIYDVHKIFRFLDNPSLPLQNQQFVRKFGVFLLFGRHIWEPPKEVSLVEVLGIPPI